MREILAHQLPVTQDFIDHPHGKELNAMSDAIDALPAEVLTSVHGDLVGTASTDVGRRGMTAEQVIRCVVIKQLNGFSYSELSFHLADSTCYRTFCRFGAIDRIPSRSTLQWNIKRLSPETMQQVSGAIASYALATEVDTGEKIRVDCTSVHTNIHSPKDSWLLFDVVRVLSRTIMRVKDGLDVTFVNHTRRAKRRAYDVHNARSQDRRIAPYRELVTLTEATIAAAKTVVDALIASAGTGSRKLAAIKTLQEIIPLGEQVVSQTRRRVLAAQKVPASEKVVSIFEPHTDLLMKGKRTPEYGHKLCLSTGASGLVLDAMVLDGNPADVTLATTMVGRHKDRYSTAPKQAAFDGAFASKENLQALKDSGVEDVMFSKRCGLEITDMTRSVRMYKALWRFRAGVEGCISFLKRCLGLDRCNYSGFASFKSYVWGAILTANLLIIARTHIAQAT